MSLRISAVTRAGFDADIVHVIDNHVDNAVRSPYDLGPNVGHTMSWLMFARNTGGAPRLFGNIGFYAIGGNEGQPQQFVGTGDPNGLVHAEIASIYQRIDGGPGNAFWVKESGAGTNTGWISK